MSNEVIHVHGKDVIVREDTARAFRWLRFETVVLSGIILLFILGILFFAWVFTAIDFGVKNSNAPTANTKPRP